MIICRVHLKIDVSGQEPTFICLMPLGEEKGKWRHVFFEETSLVASPAMDFEDLEARLYKHLSYYGTEVKVILDEAYCLILIGGEMPNLMERVVAFGGSAALVHPTAGHMNARALEIAEKPAEIVSKELRRARNADNIANRVWDRI